jgi:hypothetical protein
MKKFARAYKIYLAIGFALVAAVLAGTYLLFSNILGALGPALGG